MTENIFETIKKKDNNGKEYWSSRELAQALVYPDYRKFLNVIDRAKIACENSGEVIHSHFVDANEMVPVGSEAEKPVETISSTAKLTFGCVASYTIGTNPTAFLVQTRTAV